MCQRPHKLLHPLSLLQQVSQVLVKLRALQLWDRVLQGLLEIAVVEELGVLKARLEHCLVPWQSMDPQSLLMVRTRGPASLPSRENLLLYGLLLIQEALGTMQFMKQGHALRCRSSGVGRVAKWPEVWSRHSISYLQ